LEEEEDEEDDAMLLEEEEQPIGATKGERSHEERGRGQRGLRPLCLRESAWLLALWNPRPKESMLSDSALQASSDAIQNNFAMRALLTQRIRIHQSHLCGRNLPPQN